MSTVIGVAGGTGSGKGAVTDFLVKAFGGPEQVAVLPQDCYYLEKLGQTLEERARVNYDHPNALQLDLLWRHVEMLKQGQAVHVPKYSFAEHARLPNDRWDPPLTPKPFVIVEGILVLYDERLRGMFDQKIFVDTPDDVRLIRRMRRDVRDRGRTYESVMDQWETTVQPMHQEFCLPSRRYADIIIPEGGENNRAREMMLAWVHEQQTRVA